MGKGVLGCLEYTRIMIMYYVWSELVSWECTWIMGVYLEHWSALGFWGALGSRECTWIMGVLECTPMIQVHSNAPSSLP